MKEAKPYWFHNMAYSMEPYFVYIDFPNLIIVNSNITEATSYQIDYIC